MYLTRGGNLNEVNGALRVVGYVASYWVSSAYALATYTYSLDFTDGGAHVSGNNMRLFGLTVRVGLMKNLSKSPMYLTRGGNIALNFGALRYAGNAGYYQGSTTASSGANVTTLYFAVTNLLPSNTNTRYPGFTVWALI